MVSLLRLIAVLAFIFYQLETVTMFPFSFTSLAAPINKHIDAAKPLYSVQIMAKNLDSDYMLRNLLIDIDAPLIWHQCILKDTIVQGFFCPYPDTLCNYPVRCTDDHPCRELQTTYSYHNSSCPSINNVTPPEPDRMACTCPVNVLDPVTGSCGVAFANYDHFTMNTSNGGNFFTDLDTAYLNAACAPSSSFQSFPANVTGVMALSSSPSALSNSLYSPITKTIAMCLPSNLSSPGILFIGKGPYFLLPQSDVDVTSYLSYTPLLKKPDSSQDVDIPATPDAPTTPEAPATPESPYGPPQTVPNSFGYYIGVNAILIKNRSISLPANTTAKLSTTDPYTTLRTDIYNSVIQRVSKVTKRIPRANAIAPFSLCFKTSSKDPKVSLKIPDIDFSLLGGKNWTMSTTNTIKQVTKDEACLAFVDGGATSELAIVIGTFQFEDNFLVFDLDNSMFGFSSSLLRKQTSCSNFNSTLTNSN